MAFYNKGESKPRPGTYMRFTNRSIFASALTSAVDPGKVGALQSSDGYVLKDSNGLYIKSKEVT